MKTVIVIDSHQTHILVGAVEILVRDASSKSANSGKLLVTLKVLIENYEFRDVCNYSHNFELSKHELYLVSTSKN